MIKHYINFNHLTRLTATLTLLLSFGLMSQAQAQYTGAGEFNLITSQEELVDGYYVVTNAPGEFAMNNAHTGSLLPETPVSPVDGTLTNPDVTDVWRIEANGDGYTIFSEESGQYVSYTGSGNSIQVDSEVEGDAQRWAIEFDNGDFLFTNVAVTNRRLQYNPSAPRFVAYTGTQQDLKLYKFDETSAEEPALDTNPNSLEGLDYGIDDGPSSAQSFTLSGANLDGSDVSITAPANFAISENEVSGYGNSVTLSAFDGTETTLYVLMEAGLTEGTYSGSIDISGGGTSATVGLSGSVTPEAVVYDFTEGFDNFPETSNSYSDGSFTGIQDNTWEYFDARGDQDIDGPTVTLQNNSDSFLKTTLTGGITSFSFDYMQAFSNDVSLGVFIDGEEVAVVTSDGEESVVKNSGDIQVSDVGDTFEIEFKQVDGGNQVAIDNFSWNENPDATPVALLDTSVDALTNLDYTEGEGPSASQTVDVSGQNLDPADATITMTAPADFEVSLDDVSYSSSVTADAAAGELASTTVYVRLSDGLTAGTYNGDLTVSGGGATDATVSLSGEVIAPVLATLPYSEDFDPDLNEVLVVDVSGFNTWEQGSTDGRTYAQANGYNTGQTEETWLILPGFDLTATSDELMQFDTSYRFGNDDADNFLKLVYSTDYSGAGDPSGSTWTELPFTKPDASETVTPSGNIDLSGVSGSEVYLAFQYRYEPGSYRRWRVSDVEIFEASNPLFTVSPSELDEFSYETGDGPSSAQSFTLSGANLDGSDVSITAPANFAISENEVSGYGNSVTLSAFDGTETTLYVLMEAGLTEGTYSGAVEITGGGAPAVSVDLTGSVTPPLPALAAGEEYIEQFHDFVSAETLPGGWSVSNESYGGEWGFGTSAGLRGESVLGFQHTGSTGTFTATLDLKNETGAELSDLYISYTGRVERPTAGRSPIWTVEVNGVEQTDLSYSTESGLEIRQYAVISGLSIPDGSSFSISWSSDRGGGSGAAKQIGISDVVVSASAFLSTSLLGEAGWRLLSTPGTDVTYGDVLSNIWTQGFPGSNFNESGVESNVFTYREPTTGEGRGFQVPSASDRFGTQSTGSPSHGRAALVYVYADDNRNMEDDPFPKLLLYDGSTTDGPVTYSFSYTDTGSPIDDGWQLIGNPFNSPIDWNSVVAAGRNDNISDVFYMYDHEIDAYRIINGFPTGNDVASDTSIVAPHQGGWIKVMSDAPATLQFTEDDISSEGAELYKNTSDEITEFRINMAAADRGDYVEFSFREGASEGLDRFDAYQLAPMTERFAHIYTRTGDTAKMLTSMPYSDAEYTFPVGVSSAIEGEHTLTWTSVENLPKDWNVYLTDLETGEQVSMEEVDSYSFNHIPETGKGASVSGPERLAESGSPVMNLSDKSPERFVVEVTMTTTSLPNGNDKPEQFALNQNYPNPFNPVTQISYDLPESADVRLEVYNVQGQRVATLVNASQTAGSYNVSFDAGNLASGVYLYRLQTGSSVLTRKMTLVK